LVNTFANDTTRHFIFAVGERWCNIHASERVVGRTPLWHLLPVVLVALPLKLLRLWLPELEVRDPHGLHA
jgi:hypothetical protein